MHGRLKVKTTEEQAEAKRLERLKKLKLYQGATARIFAKRAALEYDTEALTLTGGVLAKNPDFYTLWNYRKEVFLELKSKLSGDELSAMFKDELKFLEECLLVNPKSYGTWEHRCFVMLTTPTPDWGRELDLCNKFLAYDERNFHCWDYRRFVVRHSQVKAKDELDFTSEKIANNFSNYSSWHQRSKLLPQIYPSDSTHGPAVQQETLLEEMEFVQNAFFTDPNDQSAWFYHRWLLGRAKNLLELRSIIRRGSETILTFSEQVQAEGHGELWKSPLNEEYSYTWITSEEDVSSVTVRHDFMPYTFDLSQPPDRRQSSDSYFQHEMTAATGEVLSHELESCVQLFELEPDNKWVLLTIVLLMKSLDPVENKAEILANLDKLCVVDPYRRNYYKDFRTKYLWEQAIQSQTGCALVMSRQQLTRLDHAHLLSSVTKLDLSNNELSTLYGISHMQSLEELNVSCNRLSACTGVQNMSSLVTINLENNIIEDEESVTNMRSTCAQLTTILLHGNPCSQ